MTSSFADKVCNFAFFRSLAAPCLLTGALALTAGTAGCSNDATAQPPTMMMPPVSPGTPTTSPTPYTPAYPPAAPQVLAGTGGVLSAPRVIPMFFGGDKFQTQLSAFIQAYVTGSASWQLLKEYGVGTGTAAPAVVLNQTPAAMMTDAEVQSFLAARVQDGTFTVDAQSIAVLFYPATVTITNNGSVSCKDFAGYHGTTVLGSGGRLAYAVIPRCGLEPVGALTFAISHELAEAATDPVLTAYNDLADPYSLWTLNYGGVEVGDLCQNLADPAFNEKNVGVVARVWSNSAAAAFNNPCVPAAPGPAFFSIPQHTQLQTVQLNNKLRSIEQIPVTAGQSVTIDVRMLSNSQPSPSWNVTPTEGPLPNSGGTLNAPALSFAWVEAPGKATASGQNGQTLHLKITANAAGPLGYTSFRLSSIGPTTAGGQTETDWVGFVIVNK